MSKPAPICADCQSYGRGFTTDIRVSHITNVCTRKPPTVNKVSGAEYWPLCSTEREPASIWSRVSGVLRRCGPEGLFFTPKSTTAATGGEAPGFRWSEPPCD